VNQVLGSAALWPIEFALNQLVKSDQHLKSIVHKFDDQLLEIHTTVPAAFICVHFNNGIRLSAISSNDLGVTPTARVSSKATSLLSLLLTTPGSAALSNPEIEISGDAQFVQAIFQNLKNLDLRWDDLLAPWLGDHPTHLAKTSRDSIRQWSAQSKTSMSASLSDYLREESKLLPVRGQLDQFNSAMDDLKLRIDRAKARIERLNSHL
jgi:ubiquinone biosynthesis protein UbiJ